MTFKQSEVYLYWLYNDNKQLQMVSRGTQMIEYTNKRKSDKQIAKCCRTSRINSTFKLNYK